MFTFQAAEIIRVGRAEWLGHFYKIKRRFDGTSQMFRVQRLVKGKTTKHSRNENRSHRIQSEECDSCDGFISRAVVFAHNFFKAFLAQGHK